MQAQTVDTQCILDLPIAEGVVNFNYGSVSNAYSPDVKQSYTLGQPLVFRGQSQNRTMETGFWARYALPPGAPVVNASAGDYPDRVQLMWNVDPLSAPVTEGFIIERDGAFLAQVDRGTGQFIDFNVQAGEFYEYGVIGRNVYGKGRPGISVGFVNPNGVATGQITTQTGNPVAGAVVTMKPTNGKALHFDGAGDYLCVDYNPELPSDKLTVSAWVRIGETYDSDGIIDLGSDLNKNWWIHTTPASSGKGVVLGIGQGANAASLAYEFEENPDGWHYVAVVYAGGSALLYVDGVFKGSVIATMVTQPARFSIGSHRNQGGFFQGNIDDVRIYDDILTQTDIILKSGITVSANTPNLVAYWKFDEGMGTRVFDLSSNKMHALMFGASFIEDTPDIINAGITDEGGYFVIEGVNYSSVQSFTARPNKSFYTAYSLEFNAARNGYASLTDFDLADTATIEILCSPFDLERRQSLLSKKNGMDQVFNFFIESGIFSLSLNGEPQVIGPATMGYSHFSFVLNRFNGEVKVYKDGALIKTLNYANITGPWTGTPWLMGAIGDTLSQSDYYTGLIDEVVFYSAALTQAEIQLNASPVSTGGTDIGNAKLFAYFSLDEGEGTALTDVGAGMTGSGKVRNASFSVITFRQKETPHEFIPSTRVVTLNESNTAVGSVDFTDISTVTVAGVVRFENSFCFAEGVEILVNGQPHVPQIITDKNGRFTAEFEPGSDIVLKPVYEDHSFLPGFWEIRKLNVPVAGILLQDQTKRTVSGQLAGGKCRKSIIPAGSIVKIKLTSLDGCYEVTQQLDNPSGSFVFENVPPDSMTIAVVEHSNPVIYDYFQNQGGRTLDLRMKNDTVDFIYLAPPQVEMTQLDTNSCGDPMLTQLQPSQVEIQVFEQYDGGKCYLDTALLTINNEIAGLSQFDTLMTEGKFVHHFVADAPNIISPFVKTLQITAQAHNEQDSKIQTAVVLGRRPRETTFTSTAPELPNLILRDPPGDGSYAFLESGETTCQDWTFEAADVLNAAAGVEVSLGPDFESQVGSPFYSVTLDVDVENNLGYKFEAETTTYSSNSMETCLTTSKRISTSADELVVGSKMGGDVYMGGAMNFVYGITDELIYDTANCSFLLDKGMYIFPDGFATTFIYSERQIEYNVIPSLLEIGDTASAQRWQEIINLNSQLKDDAVFARNISFDAGVLYEESQTSQVSKTVTHSWTQTFSNEFTQEFGVTINGVGVTQGLEMSWSTQTSKSASQTSTKTRTVGFQLADNDALDNFTVNVNNDPGYGTPVFEVVSGQTSCPWEPDTQPREEVQISANKYVATNILNNDEAVFEVVLGNTSPSGDIGFYTFAAVPESNPDGAKFLLNGDALEVDGQLYQISPNSSQVVTISVARGPNAYTYEGLRLALRSDCEWNRAAALNLDTTDSRFYKEIELDVYFLEPCSEVGLGFPMQDWVLTPADDNILNITINAYDNSDTDLELIRVQYRRSQGDGSWITISEVEKDSLGDVFTIVPWDTEGLQDGSYEIRAITQCTGAQNPGVSGVIKGNIERTPPSLFGLPQPADGVLSPGDQISISFNEPIRCDLLIQADVFNNNNVGLYNTATDDLIDAVISCSDNTIVITPNILNQFIENQTLRAEVEAVKDFAGNTQAEQVKWEFFVNRSSLFWQNARIDEMVKEGNELVVTRDIKNQGGVAMDYTIENIPSWMTVFPSAGTILPGEVRTVTFVFGNTLTANIYEQEIILTTAEGNEVLDVKLRVSCPDPGWTVNAADFSYSMNLTLELDVEGEKSTDMLDLVGAFVGEELRGIAPVTYSKDLDKYLLFLTVFSNQVEGETVTFKVWDASTCILFGSTSVSFPFEADNLIGTPLVPQPILTNNLVEQTIQVVPGWNWISFHVALPDSSINAALSSLSSPQGATIKGQSLFSQYFDVAGSWVGSLTSLSHRTMYQYRSQGLDSLRLLGMLVNPDSVSLPLQAGWNWISFLPRQGMEVNAALGSLTPLNGDIIKGQATFAQYVAGAGWIGNLTFMAPGRGYLLNLSNPDALTYPANFSGGSQVANRGLEGDEQDYLATKGSHWEIDPFGFEYSMNLIAEVHDENLANCLDEGDEVGAFSDGEIRGVNTPLYISELDEWVLFLTVFSNEDGGEKVSFVYYDDSEGIEYEITEQLVFIPNRIEGDLEDPVILNIGGAVATENPQKVTRFSVFPNPAKGPVFIEYQSGTGGDYTLFVTDGLGRLVYKTRQSSLSGVNLLQWVPGNLPSGLYQVSLISPEGMIESKLVELH